MDIKKLIWRDNITAKGKERGLFEILADVKELRITYHIQNFQKYGEKLEGDKYYLFNGDSNKIIECDSIEDAKLKAQDDFRQTVTGLFFEPSNI